MRSVAGPLAGRRTLETSPETVVRRRRGFSGLQLRELWEYRDVGLFLIWRDLKVRFRQTAFGVVWAILQPLLLTAIFTIFLNRVAGVYAYNLPYAVFALAGVVPWTLFSRALITSSTSLVESASIIGKVYFPRLLLPLASATSYVVDFAMSLVVLAAVMVVYGVAPTISILFVPVFSLMALAGALAFGVWLSAVNVRYRDVNFLLPFIVQLWLLATPIAYPLSRIPRHWQTLLGLNPVAGTVAGFRWAVTGHSRPPTAMVLVSAGVIIGVLVLGLVYFRRTERTFADII
ncbi:MAG TPA: ABC transporter permease [Gaiellaceae bacterium]|nr:ABC transporter permease [Gaiellaceae bacterium]